VIPLRVACIGMGWWSDVLADGRSSVRTSSRSSRASTRSGRQARKNSPPNTAAGRRRVMRAILKRFGDRGDHQHPRPNDVHLETTRGGGGGRQARFPRQADRQTPSPTGMRSRQNLPQGRGRAGTRLSASAPRAIFRWIRREIDAGVFGKLVNGPRPISARDRLGPDRSHVRGAIRLPACRAA